MRLKSMTAEAAECREKADDFADRPEGAFLLQLASAWEELALVQNAANTSTNDGRAIGSDGKSITDPLLEDSAVDSPDVKEACLSRSFCCRSQH
jgi:hypothetical protein